MSLKQRLATSTDIALLKAANCHERLTDLARTDDARTNKDGTVRRMV